MLIREAIVLIACKVIGSVNALIEVFDMNTTEIPRPKSKCNHHQEQTGPVIGDPT